MSRAHYWAIRSIRYRQHVRIERAYTPEAAANHAFGIGRLKSFQYKDLGTRIIRSDKQRIALLTEEEGWKEGSGL